MTDLNQLQLGATIIIEELELLFSILIKCQIYRKWWNLFYLELHLY